MPDEKVKDDALYHKRLFINCDGRIITALQGSTIRKIVDQSVIVIDAMLGIGVKGNLREPYLEIATIINQSDVCVISVDIPSGLPADEGTESFTSIVADYTFIIGAAKQSVFIEKTAVFYGKWEVLAIGFPHSAFRKYTERRKWTEKEFQHTLPSRGLNAHKGNHGKGLIIGGNAEMPGSIAMATKSALKAGAGLITVGTIDKVITMIASSCPEVMYLRLDEKDGYLTKNSTLNMETYDAIAFGVGMGRKRETTELVRSIIRKAQCPIIIDADGLYHLKSNLKALQARTDPAIITLHPGEMAMLLDISISELLSKPFHYTLEFASKYGVYVVLKGKNTIISSPYGNQAVETGGNPGLAKGGSGDVLTGITLAMIMQDQLIS